MSERDDGGPAYPAHCPAHEDYPDYYAQGMAGMTLRDHFAGLAMQAIVTAQPTCGDRPRIAKGAYMMADAMLAERNDEG